MQNIYLLQPDSSNFQSLLPPDDARFFETLSSFDGTPVGTSAWQPFEFQYDQGSSELALGDFPSAFQHIPIFSQRAAKVLHATLNASGELLSVKCEGDEYVALNVTVLVDALDMESSDIVRFDSGKILDVKAYVLDGSRLTSAEIFKLPDSPLMDVFVSDEFIRKVEMASLTGFLFKQVKVN
jgi:hypothetical protein